MTERPAPTPHAQGKLVAFAYTSPPMRMVMESIRHIRDEGGRVVLIGPQVRGYEEAAAVADGFIFLRRRVAPVYIDPDDRPRRYSRRWASVVARNLARRATFKPAERALGASTMWWLSARHNREALALLDSADVLTATDAGAVYLVWEAAQRNRAAAAINGVGPTLEHLGLAR